MQRAIINHLITPLTLLFLVFLMGVSKENDTASPKAAISKTETTISTDSKQSETYSPYLGKTYIGFKEALAFKESQGNYFVVNQFGYLGKYQFNKNTLKLIGVYNTQTFLNTPELQERAFRAYVSRNKWVLRKYIAHYVGKKINGSVVTESGILAAAHLAGPGNVKKYLRSYGQYAFKDAYGTTIKNYMKKFSGYDMSGIEPNRKAKAKLS